MEQAITKLNRRSGWSESENKLLWEAADEAQQQGLPLKAVFEQIARQTGRRPNSIRNYYYAHVRQRDDGKAPQARFVPFTQPEVDWLMEQVLIARSAGQSVRACLQKLSGGDHSLMLRYQNKYRAVIKSRPDYVKALVERLNSEGVNCVTPEVHHRVRSDLGASCRQLGEEARLYGDPELARACDVITRFITERRQADMPAAKALIPPIKDFLALSREEKIASLDDFCAEIAMRIGSAEADMEEITV